MVGKEVVVERERLAEVARLAAEVARLDLLDFHIKEFSEMELPIPEGQTDNSPATPIPESIAPYAEGCTWCQLLVDTNEELGFDWDFGEDDAPVPDELGYKIMMRDDPIMDLVDEGTTPHLGGYNCHSMNVGLCDDFSDACDELGMELRADGASVDEVVAAFRRWGFDVCDNREEEE